MTINNFNFTFYHRSIHSSFNYNRVKWIIVNVKVDMYYVIVRQITHVDPLKHDEM